ncbi:MAG: sulfotransferase family 2 domain-containing protein [Verrucomicrobiota bacterium]
MLKQQLDGKLCLFNHVPKTAGASLHGILKQAFASRMWSLWMLDERPAEWSQMQQALIDQVLDVNLIFGHVGYERMKGFREQGGNFCAATFIRDPIQRIVSLYLYGMSIHKSHETFRKKFPTFLEFARPSANGQCRYLIGEVTSPEDALALVKKEYHFIGITEMFDFSVFWLLQALGKNPVFFPTVKSNVTPSDIPERETITPEAIAEIEQLFQIDIYVYKQLLKEFKEVVRQRKDLAKIWQQSQKMMIDKFMPANAE